MTTTTNRHIDALLRLLDSSEGAAIFRRSVRDFAQETLATYEPKLQKTHAFPHELWEIMGEAGFFQLMAPVKYGGALDTRPDGNPDIKYLPMTALFDELGQVSGSIALSTLANLVLAMHQFVKHGSKELFDELLADMVAGKKIGAIGITEPGAGSDAIGGMKLSAVPNEAGDAWILNGEKTFITNGGRNLYNEQGDIIGKETCDYFIVYGVTKPDLDPAKKEITMFLVKKDTPGFTAEKKLEKIGEVGSETWTVRLENCKVANKYVLGGVGKGKKILMSGFPPERLELAAIAVGLPQAALDKAIAYDKKREQFGHSIVSHQGAAYQFARMQSQIMMVRHYVYVVAALTDNGIPLTNDLAASAFLEAGKLATDVSQDCIRLCGGMGYMPELGIGSIHADSILYRIGGGTDEMRLELIARAMLNLKTSETFEHAVANSDGKLEETLPVLDQERLDLYNFPLNHAATALNHTVTTLCNNPAFSDINPVNNQGIAHQLAAMQSSLMMAQVYARTAAALPENTMLHASALLETSEIAADITRKCIALGRDLNPDGNSPLWEAQQQIQMHQIVHADPAHQLEVISNNLLPDYATRRQREMAANQNATLVSEAAPDRQVA